MKCLNYLGLTDKIAKLGGQMDDLAYVDGLTGDDDTIQFTAIEEVGQRPYPVARADLQNMLMDEFGRDQIYLVKMVSLEDKADSVEVHFADGSSTQADLLSDGTHSLTRTYVLGHGTAPLRRVCKLERFG